MSDMLDFIKEYNATTSDEQKQVDWKEIEDMGLTGPTTDEFIEQQRGMGSKLSLNMSILALNNAMNEQQRGIHITTANNVVVIPENYTAEECNTAIKNEMRNIQVPEPIKYELHDHNFTKTYPFPTELTNPHKSVRGKSHHKKHHKPNKGFSLGSYKYKSR